MSILNLFLKIFDKKQYYKNKSIARIEKDLSIFKDKIEKEIQQIDLAIKNKSSLNILHSGHCGDLIYSFPLVKKLSKTHKCNLFVGVNKKLTEEYYNHPAKDVFINDKMFNFLLPLIKNQKFINSVKRHSDELIDINLDLFRLFPINLSFNSTKWYFHITGINTDLSEPYLESTEHHLIKNKIIILRSFRARNHFINYKFLNSYKEEFIFIGLKDEFEDLKKQIPKLIYYEVSNFWEMSQIIKSSKFFLGNQSLAFSIAEGLKVPRILENRPDFPVVQPQGGECYDFYFQTHFEKYFEILNGR